MTTPIPFLPYGRQDINEQDVDAVIEALRSEYLTTGPAVTAFEAALADYVEAPHAIVCSNGTAALHLASLALGLGPDDTVIVPTQSFVATANGPHYCGARVVFADVDPETGLITAELLEQAVARAEAPVRAIFPVHLNGHTPDLAGLRAIAERLGAYIVEDACHALGGRYADGSAVGACSYSDLTVFSFHSVKGIAMGEGGAITTRNKEWAEKLAILRSHGINRTAGRMLNANAAQSPEGSPNPWYYEMQALGLNYRASDILCALGSSQLKRFPEFLARRIELARLYDAALSPLGPMIAPVKETVHGRSGWHLYAVKIEFGSLGLSRAALMERLREKGIGSQVHYIPIHLQPYWQAQAGPQSLPGAERYYNSCLSIPFFPAMTGADQGRVVSALTELVEGAE